MTTPLLPRAQHTNALHLGTKRMHLSPDHFRQCVYIIDELVSTYDCHQFMSPVPSSAGIYHSKIKRPMDLKTLEQKLFRNRYKNVKDFAKDLFLIWENAMFFHLSVDPIYQQALTLKKRYDEIILFIQGGKRPRYLSTEIADVSSIGKTSTPEELYYESNSKREKTNAIGKSTLYAIHIFSEEDHQTKRMYGGTNQHVFQLLNAYFFEYMDTEESARKQMPLPRLYIAKNRTLLKQAHTDPNGALAIIYDIKVTPVNIKNETFSKIRATVLLAEPVKAVHDVDDSTMDFGESVNYSPKAWIKVKPLQAAVHNVETIINKEIDRSCLKKVYTTFRLSTKYNTDPKKIRNLEVAKYFAQCMLNPVSATTPEATSEIAPELLERFTSDNAEAIGSKSSSPAPQSSQKATPSSSPPPPPPPSQNKKDIPQVPILRSKVVSNANLDLPKIAQSEQSFNSASNLVKLKINKSLPAVPAVPDVQDTPSKHKSSPITIDAQPKTKVLPITTAAPTQSSKSNPKPKSDSTPITVKPLSPPSVAPKTSVKKLTINPPRVLSQNQHKTAKSKQTTPSPSSPSSSTVKVHPESSSSKPSSSSPTTTDQLPSIMTSKDISRTKLPPLERVCIVEEPRGPIVYTPRLLYAQDSILPPLQLTLPSQEQDNNTSYNVSLIRKGDDFLSMSYTAPEPSRKRLVERKPVVTLETSGNHSDSTASYDYSSPEEEDEGDSNEQDYQDLTRNSREEDQTSHHSSLSIKSSDMLSDLHKETQATQITQNTQNTQTYTDLSHSLTDRSTKQAEHVEKATKQTDPVQHANYTKPKQLGKANPAKSFTRYVDHFENIEPIEKYIKTTTTLWSQIATFARQKKTPIVDIRKYDQEMELVAHGDFKSLFYLPNDNTKVIETFKRMTINQRVSKAVGMVQLAGLPHMPAVYELLHDGNDEIVGLCMQRFKMTLKDYIKTGLTAHQKLNIIIQLIETCFILKEVSMGHMNLSSVHFMVSDSTSTLEDGAKKADLWLVNFSNLVFLDATTYRDWWVKCPGGINPDYNAEVVPRSSRELDRWCERLPAIESKPIYKNRLYHPIQVFPQDASDQDVLFQYPFEIDLYSLGVLIMEVVCERDMWEANERDNLDALRKLISNELHLEGRIQDKVPTQLAARTLILRFLQVAVYRRKSAKDALVWITSETNQNQLLSELEQIESAYSRKRPLNEIGTNNEIGSKKQRSN